ncbi:MAG: hypothetical protein FWC41_08925 [Firmicutes bacterium]|nr:hypothetical protein [Bacillota bacterium]
MYKATVEQLEDRVVDLKDNSEIINLLNFEEIPTKEEIQKKVTTIAEIAENVEVEHAMIGGALFLMSSLESELKIRNITPLYAFSKRESVEKEVNGKIIKKQMFKHLGFVEV